MAVNHCWKIAERGPIPGASVTDIYDQPES